MIQVDSEKRLGLYGAIHRHKFLQPTKQSLHFGSLKAMILFFILAKYQLGTLGVLYTCVLNYRY